MVRIQKKFEPRTGIQHTNLNKINPIPKTPTSKTEFRQLSKFNQERFKEKKTSNGNSFPGRISGSPDFIEGSPGLFTKSIKGMEGKKYIENAINAALRDYKTTQVNYAT